MQGRDRLVNNETSIKETSEALHEEFPEDWGAETIGKNKIPSYPALLPLCSSSVPALQRLSWKEAIDDSSFRTEIFFTLKRRLKLAPLRQFVPLSDQTDRPIIIIISILFERLLKFEAIHQKILVTFEKTLK